MPAGDLVVTDEQFEWGGLLFGVGTDRRVVTLTGLDKPAVRSGDLPRDDGDGSSVGPDRSNDRLIVARLELLDLTELDDVLDVMDPADTEAPFVFRGYLRGATKLRVYAKPKDCRWRYDRRSKIGRVVAAELSWTCPDPLVYVDAASSLNLTAATPATVANSGKRATDRWELTIPVGAVNPSLAASTGESIDLPAHTVATNPVIINGHTHEITQNGVDIFTEMSNPSRFFKLAPGNTDVTYDRDSGGGTATFTWRSAWL